METLLVLVILGTLAYFLVATKKPEWIELIKSKINLKSKEINSKEAEKIISEFNKPNLGTSDKSKTPSPAKTKSKTKKISKK